MATTIEFLNYFLEQLKDIPDISCRRMMGEYLIYYKGKLIGDICDNRVFIKPVSSALDLLPDAEMCPPYQGAKDMIVLEDLENAEFFAELFDAMYAELPEPKTKKRKA